MSEPSKASEQSRSDFGRMSDQDTPAIHIYPQYSWHADAWIVGNRVGLQALRDAINKALETGKPKVCDAFPCDGEGYGILVAELKDDQIQELHLPYYEQSGWAGKGKHPYEIIGSASYRRAMTPEEEADDEMFQEIENDLEKYLSLRQIRMGALMSEDMAEDLQAYDDAFALAEHPEAKHLAGLFAVRTARRARREAQNG